MPVTQFQNSKLNKEAYELSAFPSESESDAQRRLQAMGWSFSGVDYEFDENKKKFLVNRDEDKTVPEGDPNGK